MKTTTWITKVTSIVFVALLFGLQDLSAQAQDGYITVKHQLGATKVKLNPKKVVIFDIGTLETYHELGIPVAGVTNSVPAYLSQYRSEQYEKLGSIKSPNIEAIKAFAPDLVIISGRQSRAYDSLSMVAPTIFLGVDTKNYWETFERNVKTIAKLHGKERLAEQKLAELKQKRDLITTKTKTDNHKGLVLLHVRGGHTAYGPGARFGFIHDVLGFRPALDNLKDATHTGNRFKERDGFVQKADPDYIFLIDRDSATGGGERKPTDELLSSELKQTKAYKNKKVVDLPGNIWYVSGGGLYSVDKMITDVGEQLYGLIF